MRDLARISALVGVLLSAGCGGEDGPPDLGPAAQRGGLTVRWSLFNASGEPMTCASIGAVDAYVAVGGQPRIVPCGDEQVVTFEDLLPQRYPVVIRLRGLAETTLPQGERFDNVTVVGDQTVDYTHEFHFDAGADNQGAVRFSWQVDSQPAATGCGSVGATTVHGETSGGSVASFTFDAPCADGEFVQSNLRPGNYEILLYLRDAAGTTLSARSGAFRIIRGSVAEASVAFNADSRPKASMLVNWTLTSSDTPPCREDWSIELVIQQDLMNPITTASATAACDAGTYRFDDLTSPANPIADRYKVTVSLIETLRGEIARAFADDLPLLPAQTTTVSVQLTPPEP